MQAHWAHEENRPSTNVLALFAASTLAWIADCSGRGSRCSAAGCVWGFEQANAPISLPPPMAGSPPQAAAETLPPGEPAPAICPPIELPAAPPIVAIPDSVFSGVGGRGDLFRAMWGPPKTRLGYKAIWFPEEDVIQQATHFGYVDQGVSFSAPLWHNDVNVWSFNLGVRSEIFSTDAILPDTHQPFPVELWNIRFGTSFRHDFANGWSEVSSVSLGSASDKPFAPTDRVTVGFNEILRVPQGDHNAWLFSLSYSNNSQLDFPIPGVAYLYQPSDTFRATVGVPFSLMWRPREDVIVDASYSLIRQVHARVTYVAVAVAVFHRLRLGQRDVLFE